jgi:cytidylate kinase
MMWNNIGFDLCQSFINCQLRPGETKERSSRLGPPIAPSITISRMTGSGGRAIASKLAEYLQARIPVDCHWTVFDRTLIERTLEDHHLPKRMAEYMPECHKPVVADVVEELFGLHPSSWTLVRQTSETILRLARLGHVILVGRGANVVTSKLDNVYHVRLVGSLERRMERVQEVSGLERHQALDFIRKEDSGRKRYLKDHFREDIDDPLLYHLVINTDRMAYDDAARMIGREVIERFDLEPYEPTAFSRATVPLVG